MSKLILVEMLFIRAMNIKGNKDKQETEMGHLKNNWAQAHQVIYISYGAFIFHFFAKQESLKKSWLGLKSALSFRFIDLV